MYSPMIGVDMLVNQKLFLSNGAWYDFFPGTVQAPLPGHATKGYGLEASPLAVEFVSYRVSQLEGNDYTDFFPGL